jgi:hypothetical protein
VAEFHSQRSENYAGAWRRMRRKIGGVCGAERSARRLGRERSARWLDDGGHECLVGEGLLLN